ncbi:nitrogen fixation protein FixH [Aureimonas sp. SA4125]|uniref:FixH family protein n=1 Tax=Aureimonas sp. SA4125 TaxID=2826993 RepID=UPI001CC794B3|nr:FixH family protein [Aureimonas sp. SA4125]BDA84177.1 nitrogen fixation protein FixH [Aureimonas sp. SA4125]
MSKPPLREFTGWHMLTIMLLFFGSIIGVNFLMAYSAVTSFAGLVVENSYVASQHFDEKLVAMRRQQALGWTVELAVLPDSVTVDVRDAHGDRVATRVDVEMTRPTTNRDDHFLHADETLGPVRLPTALKPGAWDATVSLVDSAGETFLTTRRVVIGAPAPVRP